MANPSRRQKLNHSAARTLAALVGTMPVALALGLVLALALPLSPTWRLLFGAYSVFPAWVTLAALVFLAPNGRRAWLGLIAALAVLGVVGLLTRRLGPGFPAPGRVEPGSGSGHEGHETQALRGEP